MTLRRPPLLAILAVPLAFLAALFAFRALDASPTVPGGSAALPDAGAPARSTAGRIAALQGLIRSGARDARTYSALGDAQLQRVRETGDAGYYSRAQAAYATALRIAPRSSEALTGRGTLALARHDFAGGLRDGLAALRANPQRVAPLYVITDAQVELGRYDDAARTLQRALDLKPTLAAYARASYLRELRGDLPGAVSAMNLAISAGGPATENVAYVQTLLGGLELARGRVAAARLVYRGALERSPGYVPAAAGLARTDAARGGLETAIRRLREAVTRLPLPEYVVALGEAELAAGRTAAARRDLGLVRAEERLLQSAGVNTDTELAVFEAEHGDPARGVALARRAWATAPSVRSADALGYALARDGRAGEGLPWSRRALRFGWSDPLALYHAGMTARAAGEARLARTWLGRVVKQSPSFSPLFGPRARRALEGLR
jgi:tetratricopeptide (TPR) repeat protein